MESGHEAPDSSSMGHHLDPNSFGDRADIENARHKLANALLSVASVDSRDVGVLKRAALSLVALDLSAISASRPCSAVTVRRLPTTKANGPPDKCRLHPLVNIVRTTVRRRCSFAFYPLCFI
jgi:hypothetical protein